MQLIDKDGVLAYWDPKTDCCGWKGVFCDTTGRVASLDVNANCNTCIGNQKLIADPKGSGFGASLGSIAYGLSITKEVGNLVKLTELILWGNRFPGGVPDSIANLKNLKSLFLENNQMTTIGFTRITSLKKLDRLILSYNKLSGSISKWLSGVTLTGIDYGELNLAFNQFTGYIPGELCSIKPFLEILGLNGNKLSGPIPSTIRNCAQLRFLFLGDNYLSGPLPQEFGKLKNLDSIFAANNKLTGPLPRELGDLPNFNQMHIDHNKIMARFLQITLRSASIIHLIP